MQIELNSNYFNGFYESIYLNSEEFIDYEMEDAAELQELTGNSSLEVYYEYDNINQYQADVCREFMDLYFNEILDALPNTIKDHKFFKLEPVPESLEIWSPKYYNYQTDRTFLKVNTNLETINIIKHYVLNLPGVESYLIDNWTSCSGFISFISNNINYWKQTPAKDYKTIYFYVLFDMLIYLTTGPERLEELNYETAEHIEKLEYITPYVEINNKKINYYEFKNQILKDV